MPECTCNMIPGNDDVEVFPNQRGSVTIKQLTSYSEDGYVLITVSRWDVPRLIELLQRAAGRVCAPHDLCDVHGEKDEAIVEPLLAAKDSSRG